MNIEVPGKFIYHEKDQQADCQYAVIPTDNPDEKNIVFILLDGRKTQGHRTKLIISSKVPDIKNGIVTELNEYASIYCKSSSCSQQEFNGSRYWQYWLHSGANIDTDHLIFSYLFSHGKKMHFLELAKRGQQLFISPKYEWVTSYYKDGEKMIPVEIQGEEIEEKISS